jgi:hypothetical protein
MTIHNLKTQEISSINKPEIDDGESIGLEDSADNSAEEESYEDDSFIADIDEGLKSESEGSYQEPDSSVSSEESPKRVIESPKPIIIKQKKRKNIEPEPKKQKTIQPIVGTTIVHQEASTDLISLTEKLDTWYNTKQSSSSNAMKIALEKTISANASAWLTKLSSTKHSNFVDWYNDLHFLIRALIYDKIKQVKSEPGGGFQAIHDTNRILLDTFQQKPIIAYLGVLHAAKTLNSRFILELIDAKEPLELNAYLRKNEKWSALSAKDKEFNVFQLFGLKRALTQLGSAEEEEEDIMELDDAF